MGLMTAAKVKALKDPGRYNAGQTLYLFVTHRGTRSWVQRLVVDGQRRDIGLGGYPGVTLAEARDMAFENRRLARKGGDPLAYVRQSHVPTFRRAAKRTHEANCGRWSKQTADTWLNTLERYAVPAFGDRRIDKIDRGDVLRVLSPVWSSRPAIAKNLRGAIRPCWHGRRLTATSK